MQTNHPTLLGEKPSTSTPSPLYGTQIVSGNQTLNSSNRALQVGTDNVDKTQSYVETKKVDKPIENPKLVKTSKSSKSFSPLRKHSFDVFSEEQTVPQSHSEDNPSENLSDAQEVKLRNIDKPEAKAEEEKMDDKSEISKTGMASTPKSRTNEASIDTTEKPASTSEIMTYHSEWLLSFKKLFKRFIKQQLMEIIAEMNKKEEKRNLALKRLTELFMERRERERLNSMYYALMSSIN